MSVFSCLSSFICLCVSVYACMRVRLCVCARARASVAAGGAYQSTREKHLVNLALHRITNSLEKLVSPIQKFLGTSKRNGAIAVAENGKTLD